MPGLVYKFDGCVNRGDFAEFDDVIESILRQEAHVELMQGHAIYKTRVKSNGIEKTQPRLLFSAVPSRGNAFFAVLGVVFNHNYHRSKFLQPSVLDQYLSKNVTRFLDEARHLISNEVDNARLVQTIEQRQWVPVDYHHQACYYDKQFVIPSDPQRLAISLPSPAVFSGPAGSGKSYILFEKLRELLARMGPEDEGQIIFVAKSAELAADLQAMWGTFSTSVLNNHRVVFKRYDQVLAEQDSFCAEENKASEADWFEWFTGYLNELERAADTGKIPQEWIVNFRQDPEAVFEEFRIISLYAKQAGHFTQKQYLNELGQRQSLFSRSKTSGPRDVLLKAYTDYQRYLNDSGRWDPSFREFNIPRPVYFATMVDEALDLSLLQVYLLFLLTEDAKIFYAVDSHQRLRDRISFRPTLLSMLRKLTGRVFHAHLPGSYRCSNKVVRLTNELIQIKIDLTGGIADQNEIKEIALSADPQKEYGDIFQLRPKKNEDLALRDMFPSTFWAIVTREEYIEEAGLRYGTSLVFTPEQIKGLGYKYIIVYKLLDDSERLWVEANEQLGPIIEGVKVKTGRSVKGIGDSRFAPLCNNLITSVTRTIDSLFIVQDTPHELRHITSRCAKHMTSNEELEPCLSKIKALSTFDRAAMLDHAEYLLRNHRDVQARNFCLHELGLSDEEFVEFKIERLDVKTVIKPSELVENQMLSDGKESGSQSATLTAESIQKKPHKRAKKKSASKLGASEFVISQDSSLIAPVGGLLQPSNTSLSISPISVSDLERHLSVCTRSSEKQLVGINYNEESIKALLADFTLESLTHWFSDTKAIASLALTIHQRDGGLTSLCETILSSPLLTPIFCQFLMKSEQSTTQFGLIHRIANEVEFPCGGMVSHLAAALNCVPLLELFAAYSVDLERGDRHCRSPLFFAIWQRHQSAIDILMQSGARLSHVFDQGILVQGESMVPFFVALDYSSPDIIDRDGRLAPIKDVMPLFRAAEKGDLRCLKFILRETDVDINSIIDANGANALLIAVQNGHRDIVQALIRAGANINQPMNNGATALILAAQFGYLDIALLLLKAGAMVDQWGLDGCTPLMSAVNFGRAGVVEALFDADASLYCKMFTRGYSASVIANRHYHQPIMKLIDHEADLGEAILELLERFSYANLMTVLLKKKDTLLLRRISFEADSKTPIDCLLMSILMAPENMHYFCRLLRTDELGKLIAVKLANERRLLDGATAMHFAAAAGCVELIDLFVDCKFDIDVPNNIGERPIHVAVRRGHLQATLALIRAGANVTQETKGRYTPSRVFPTPLYVGIEADSQQSHLKIVFQLIADGSLLGHNPVIFHPLLIAAKLGNELYIRILLKRGVDINARDLDKKTALYVASEAGYEAVVTLLLNSKADVNLALPNGMTPLMIAVKLGHLRVALILIEFGADEHKVTQYGQDVFSIGIEAEQMIILADIGTAINERNLRLTASIQQPSSEFSAIESSTTTMQEIRKSPLTLLSTFAQPKEVRGTEDIPIPPEDTGFFAT